MSIREIAREFHHLRYKVRETDRDPCSLIQPQNASVKVNGYIINQRKLALTGGAQNLALKFDHVR